MRLFFLPIAILVAQDCRAQAPDVVMRTEVSYSTFTVVPAPSLPTPSYSLEASTSPNQWHAESMAKSSKRVDQEIRALTEDATMEQFNTRRERGNQLLHRVNAIRAATVSGEKPTRGYADKLARSPSGASPADRISSQDVSNAGNETPESKLSEPGVYSDYFAADVAVAAAKAVGLVPEVLGTLATVRCTKIQLHAAHHPFPLLGRMCHLQVNCYLKGIKISHFSIRVPVPDALCPKP